VADFISFNEGRKYLATSGNGLPSTCYFGISTKAVSAFAVTDTLSTSGEITGTGYARQSQSAPTPTSANPSAISFTQMSWATGSATDWSSAAASCFLASTSDNTGKILCAWNLQAGGATRNLAAANTTENFTPTLDYA
jgi:hypothetical protein